MFTILGGDGKEYGPASAAKIAEWIAAGRANLQTKARRSGETEWRTLGDYPEFNPAAVPPPIAPPLESGLAGAAPATAAATAAAAAIPAPAPGPVQLTGTPAEIAAILAPNAARFDPFDCISRSFDLWKSHFLPLVGVTTLMMIIQMAIGLVPILGSLSGLILSGVFYGGLYYYYLGKMRGQPREVGDLFAGFSKAFVPLMLANLLMTLIILVVMVPFFGPFFLVMVKAALSGTMQPGQLPPLSGAAIGIMVLGFIPMIYLSISWMFTFMLVIDRGLGPWTAMEVSRRVIGRRWFSLLVLVICATILGMLGLIGLFIGVLFTLPLTFGSILYAYEDLCTPPQA